MTQAPAEFWSFWAQVQTLEPFLLSRALAQCSSNALQCVLLALLLAYFPRTLWVEPVNLLHFVPSFSLSSLSSSLLPPQPPFSTEDQSQVLLHLNKHAGNSDLGKAMVYITITELMKPDAGSAL